jgi:hypothetical protein
MPAWVWALIAIAAIVVVAIVVWQLTTKRRSKRLQDRFGPEYERTIEGSKNRREAEAQLAAREKRHEQLDLRPLSRDAHDRYTTLWEQVQSQFVDSPQAAVAAADTLIQDVMRDRGYPVENFEQRAADVSVEHPQVVDNYREGHRLAQASASGDGSTEDLRLAMRHYRALFIELTEPAADDATGRERVDEDDRQAARDNADREKVR